MKDCSERVGQEESLRRLGCGRAPLRSTAGLVLLGLALSLAAFAKPAVRLESVFNTNKLAEMDQAILAAIEEKRLPGAVLWLERSNVVYKRAYGERALVPAPERMTEDTIFDLASLTKVVATAPAVVLLVERGQIKLDARVRDYIPEFGRKGKEEVTIQQLLTHTSGLRSGLGRKVDGVNTALFYACEESLTAPPGTAFCYSDINFILLAEVVRRVAHSPMDSFAQAEFFGPLKMRETGYLPGAKLRPRIAPTAGTLRGRVHDPTAQGMGGVAGHAGVFGTTADLARFARMMLNEGELEGVRVLRPESVRLMTSVQSPDTVAARRGLGWDIDTGYSRRGKVFPIGSYGHTGFTGGSLWIDPFSRTFIVFLSNRVHPDGHGDVRTLQSTLGTLAAEAVIGFDFANVPGALPPRTNAPAGPGVDPSTNAPPGQRAAVLNGIDVLKKQNFAPLRGLRVGLITNHTGRDREGNPTIDLLQSAAGVTLKALFSPEHGLRGQADEKVGDAVDSATGLPVHSLYGPRRSPTPEQLAGLDALVFDIQDIGCRFYTYAATMGLCLEAAAAAKLKFFVLDRVNPINGVTIEGPVYHGEPVLTAFHELPLRHGMTLGELARMFNEERGWRADLTVVPVEGWTRDMWFDETGLRWVKPSPNMPDLAAATVYPGLGLLEFSISVGRGTPKPFAQAGAPYVDEQKLAAELNAAGLPGIRFEPARFTPASSVFKDRPCAGVSLVLTERARCPAVDVGLVMATAWCSLYPEQFDADKLEVLLKDPVTLDAIRSGRSLAEIHREWAGDLEKFKQRRQRYLLYH